VCTKTKGKTKEKGIIRNKLIEMNSSHPVPTSIYFFICKPKPNPFGKSKERRDEEFTLQMVTREKMQQIASELPLSSLLPPFFNAMKEFFT